MNLKEYIIFIFMIISSVFFHYFIKNSHVQTFYTTNKKQEKEKYKRIIWPWENKENWEIIKKILENKIENPKKLDESIKIISKCSFEITFFQKYFSKNFKEYKLFFNETLPFIQNMALKLPNLFEKGIIK